MKEIGIFKRVYINLLGRVLLLILTCLLFAWEFIKMNDLLINLNFLFFIFFQAYLLLKYLNRINRDLSGFFHSIKYDDYSIGFSKTNYGGSYNELYECLDEINKKIRKYRINSESQEQYYRSLVKQVEIGLICFNDKNGVEFCNDTALQLLGRKNISNIEDIALVDKNLGNIISKIQPSESKIARVSVNNEILQLSVKLSKFIVIDKKLKLISLQNIKNELDEKELESWQKLIRVLTHEIMNSIGPVSSTIKTILEFLMMDNFTRPKLIAELNDELIADSVKGLKIIDDRSAGLVDFVQKFRSLTLLPRPDIKSISINILYEEIRLLLKDKLENKNINIEIDCEEKLELQADKKLIEQVLINLINNSINALEKTENKLIQLKAYTDFNEKICIQLIDNGEGIPIDIIDKIFIPFFTTGDKGTGIGLSLSKQIMLSHGGTISVQSDPDKETVFTLRF
ncbi:PAS domain-containing sensor histidine kinase [Bacteroidota bacterium]